MGKPAIFTVKPCGGGVNKDLLASELDPAQWTDALNMRFVNGFAERRGGLFEAYTAPSVIPYALATYITPASRFLVRAGLARVFVDDGTTVTEITRYTDGVQIASMTAAGTTVTVTTTGAHGRSTGNLIDVFGAVETAYNVTGKAITVTGGTTFTYVADSAPAAPATTVGQYSYNVQSNFTGAIDDKWTIFPFNGILIFNHPVDGPYYWNGDTALRMRRLPGWIGRKAYFMWAFKNYLIAGAPTLSSTFYPHLVMWSTSAESGAIPTTWTAAATNDAGDTPQTAEASGQLIDGRPLGDSFILYKDDARFALDFVGGNSVFRLRKLPANDGALARSCIIETPKGHVFLSNGDVRIHQGADSVSIAEGRVRRFLFDSMDTNYSQRSFLCINKPKCEVWIVYPQYGQQVPDIVLAWNWNDDTWGIFEIPPTTCATSGLIVAGLAGPWDSLTFTWSQWTGPWARNEYTPNEQRLILGHQEMAITLADTGVLDLGESVEWRLEKRGTTFEDAQTMKVLSWSRPHVDAPSGTEISVYHTTTQTADEDPDYGTATTFTVGESIRANRFSKAGRFLSYKMEGSADAIHAVRSYDVGFAVQGLF